MAISTVFSKVERTYTGVELRPHFLLSELGLKGSGLGAFIGPCQVKTEHLVDWEDRLASDRIEARWMVHFIGEFFGIPGLREGVLLQRLLMSILGDEVNARLLPGGSYPGGPYTTGGAVGLCRRDGDDLFIGGAEGGARKLSVSIVTASPVSLLLHTGINIDPAGAPVPAIGLAELGILPDEWVPAVLKRFEEEMQGIEWACAKVRPVL